MCLVSLEHVYQTVSDQDVVELAKECQLDIISLAPPLDKNSKILMISELKRRLQLKEVSVKNEI
jgi:hypothetical protein